MGQARTLCYKCFLSRLSLFSVEFIFDKHFVIHSGLCPIALGTDGGGSIRIPAAACGVVGIKG